MIGRLNSKDPSVGIAGGGLSGLLAAYRLAKAGWKVTLYERSDRLGGQIQTHALESGLAESAAHSFLASPEVRNLCDELDVPLLEARKGSRARFILRDRRLRRFPLSAGEFLSLAKKAILARGDREDRPLDLEEWGARHLGEAGLKYLLDPMIAGIFACKPRELSLDAAFPGWRVPGSRSLVGHLRARRKAKRAQGRSPVAAPAGGMQRLIEGLIAGIEHFGARIETGREAPSESAHPNWVVANAASVLPDLAYSPLVSATFFVEASSLASVPEGIGFLCPSSEKRAWLGVLFNSFAFSDRVSSPKVASFTAMLGGTRDPGALKLTESQILDAVSNEWEATFKVKPRIVESRITRWERAIPLYSETLGREWERLARAEFSKAGKVFFSNASGQVSVRGLIESSAEFASLKAF